MLKATIYSTLILGLLSAFSLFEPKIPPISLQKIHKPPTSFVVISPPVSWKFAEEVCHRNGLELAKLDDDSLAVAAGIVKSIGFGCVWIDSYKGTGSGNKAAAMLKPEYRRSAKIYKSTVVKVWNGKGAENYQTFHPVLCHWKQKSKSSSRKAKKQLPNRARIFSTSRSSSHSANESSTRSSSEDDSTTDSKTNSCSRNSSSNDSTSSDLAVESKNRNSKKKEAKGVKDIKSGRKPKH